MKKDLLALLMFLLAPNLAISQHANQKDANVAEAYMEAYSNWDVEKMGELYHPDVHFHDPTAEVAFPNGKYEFTGKQNVKGFFEGVWNKSKPNYIELQIANRFTVGNIYIFHSIFHSILPGDWFGKDITEKVFISITLDSIIEISDGLIISHTDYADYTTYNKQIQAQLAK